MGIKKIYIDTSEEFPHLSSAPIVEAVVDLRAKPALTFDEASAMAFLTPKLGEYEYLDSQQQLNHELTFGTDFKQKVTNHWKGLRVQNAGRQSTASYNIDGFVLSKLAPYSAWADFSGDALHLWDLYDQLAKPEWVDRIGLRFINRIELAAGDGAFEKYIDPAPQSPRGIEMPFFGFLHQETFGIPETIYAINLIRAIQPPQGSGGFAIIIDIDVFTTETVENKIENISRKLEEMHWVKNKVFFGSVTEEALEVFKC